MANTFFVYVPAGSAANFVIGTRRLMWGWKDAALDRRNNASGGITNREIASSIEPDDLLIFGHRGPDPRGPEVGYRSGVFAEVMVFKARSRLHSSTEVVWADDIYPNRVDLEFVEGGEGWGADLLSADGMLAFRNSANAHGTPFRITHNDALAFETAALSETTGFALDPSETHDAYSLAVRRREQSKLRAEKLAGRGEAPCDLCGQEYPATFLVAAHIKRRADCNPEERAELSNVLLACLFGCDALFEAGLLGIDPTGCVSTVRHAPPSLREAVQVRIGHVVTQTPRVLEFAAEHWASHNP
ncbi:hypothetical protein [Aeromicrobium alkaliterrae]|uniref:HNH endonuclease n=1 Tax=Aeromicrobium alkaliterrae TaxID=302168 RepID=A0ABN2K9F7_9ACTN